MRRAALTLSIAFVSVAGAGAALSFVLRKPDEVISDASMLLSFAVFAMVGGLLVSRRPQHPIGWIYSIGSLAAALGHLFTALTWVDLQTDTELPLRALVWWVSAVFGVLPLIVLIPLPLLFFPHGRLPSRRWRPLLWTATAAVMAIASYPAFSDAWFGEDGPKNPVAIPGAKPILQGLNEIGLLALIVVTVAVIVSLFRRFRRTSGAEREQFKWLAWAGVWTVVLIFMAGPGTYGIFGRIEALQPVLEPLTPFFFALGIAVIPLFMAFAVLRYRLWAIDRIISRTFSYAMLTAILGGAFALMVLLPPVVFGADNAPDYVIAVATLIVAALFRPLRSRVQARVDRRFNRGRYDAERTIEAFTARLREQVDIDALGAELRHVVYRTMQPMDISLWMRPTKPR
jgi:hypothetical protein